VSNIVLLRKNYSATIWSPRNKKGNENKVFNVGRDGIESGGPSKINQLAKSPQIQKRQGFTPNRVNRKGNRWK